MLVSKFLIERLKNLGLKHVFGVPGDYVLDFYKDLCESNLIDVVNTTDEAHAGFAADAYARINGVGCAVVTYSVGASKLINAVQCAYAERSPMIVISGAPGVAERNEDLLLHHMVRHFNSQKKMFDEITCSSIVLDDPNKAGYDIDKALECLQYYKRPIYIEVPRDVLKQSLSYDVYKVGTPTIPKTDNDILEEAIEDSFQLLKNSKNPVILASVEISRYNLGEKMMKFAEKNNIPVTTTMLGKSVINEKNHLFAGIYQGPASLNHTKQLVEDSDCLLVFGDYHHDINLCFKPAKFIKKQSLWTTVESLKIRNHNYANVNFVDFCNKLFCFEDSPKADQNYLKYKESDNVFCPKKETLVTSNRIFEKINSILNKDMAICADIGDSLFGALSLIVHHKHHFLSPAFYTTMGASIPYSLGVQTLFPNIRPIVIIGDGAFQMSCTELSTIVNRGLNPIVFILNNDGYTTERFLLEGKFNNLNQWNYEKILDVFGKGKGFLVKTEEDLEEFTNKALDLKETVVLNIILNRRDSSDSLKRVTEFLSKII